MARTAEKGALSLDKFSDGQDYILKGDSVWVEVGGVSVWIRKSEEGNGREDVLIEIFKRGEEANGNPIDTARARIA